MTFGNLNESIGNETITLIWIICGQFDICFSQVICKGISIKVFKVTVLNSLWFESSKAGFDKRCYKFVVITNPVSMTLLLWKESGSFVRIKSIVYLCVFVMQISFLSKCCRLKKLQNCSDLSLLLFEISISTLKSPMVIKFAYDSLALLNESGSSLKKVD